MPNPLKLPAKAASDPRALLRRACLPLFLFSAVLLLLLLLSWVLILPRFTEVEVAGSIRSLQEVREYHDRLTAQLLESERERNGLVLPMEESAYAEVIEGSLRDLPVTALRSALKEVATAAVSDGKGVVEYTRLSYDLERKRVSLEGLVRDAGPQVLTILAQFLEDLRGTRFVASLEHAQLTRREDAAIGMYAPFSVTLQLQ